MILLQYHNKKGHQKGLTIIIETFYIKATLTSTNFVGVNAAYAQEWGTNKEHCLWK